MLKYTLTAIITKNKQCYMRFLVQGRSVLHSMSASVQQQTVFRGAEGTPFIKQLLLDAVALSTVITI